MTLKNIVWLASYPKSGNTWTRAFLANYLLDRDDPLPINQLHAFGIGDSSVAAYRLVANGLVDLQNYMESLRLRPKVIRGIANNRADINFVKTHNMNTKAFGQELINAEFTRNAIYIVRNPLDVVVSYSRHFATPVDKTIHAFTVAGNSTAADAKNVKQFLGGWSQHVKGWTEGRLFPVHVMRYEDMMAKPEETFGGLLKDLGFGVDPVRLDKAIRFSSFDELSKQEKKDGFVERSDNSETFFHTGKTEQWKENLTPEQIEQIKKDHAPMMKKFGYL